MSNTTHAYFDLKHFINEIKNADVAAQMAQSVAFAIDLKMASTLRAIMKNVRNAHHDYGFDSVGAMTYALRDMNFAEEVFREHGKTEEGLIETFTMLNLVRTGWHELAQELTGMTVDWQGIPRRYEIKPFEEFLSREIKLDVRPEAERRIRLTVERRADGASKQDIDTVVEKRRQREEQKAKDTSAALMDQSATLMTIYHLLDEQAFDLIERDPYEDEPGFHDLPADVRMQLINAALRGAARAEEFAVGSSSVTDDQFDQINFAVLTVERQLKAILQGPGYTVQRATATA